jgi:Xaa-Pro aminopeptidase
MIRRLATLLLLLSAGSLALERQPNADYHARRERLAKEMKGGVLVLFAGTEAAGQNAVYGFHQDNNFYYLTGWSEPGAAVVIASPMEATADHPARPYAEVLYLPAHNVAQEKWTGPKLGPENAQARDLTGFDRVEVLDKMRDDLVGMLPQPAVTVFSDIPTGEETSASTEALAWLHRANAFPNYVAFKDVKPMLGDLRRIKDAGEIELIRKATNASIAGQSGALKAVKPGVTEREIAALQQYEFGKRGCERPAYAPIVGSGFDSTVLHYSEDTGTLKDGDLVVMDVAGEYSMYASDITRTAPINGKFTARQREIYDIVLGAQQAAMKAFVAGKSVLTGKSDDALYKVAFNYINTHGKDLHGEPLGKYFIHGLGHYVGLEVHDAGSYTTPLQPGMVFTIEPGIYIPEEKLGVRIEDIYYVDASGQLVDYTAALPHTADEVERAMKK